MIRSRRSRTSAWGRPHTDPAFRPYALALGQLALSWNELHEWLAMLFCTVMGGGYANQFLAVWHAINSDRNQRAILIASIENDLNRPTRDDRHSALLTEVKWICGQANVLEDLRNDALHSPLVSLGRHVMPMTGLGHVRAQKLLNKKDLLAEFRRCRDTASRLAEYVEQIDNALVNGQPLPNRPRLPTHAETTARKSRRPKQKEALAHPPQSSPP